MCAQAESLTQQWWQELSLNCWVGCKILSNSPNCSSSPKFSAASDGTVLFNCANFSSCFSFLFLTFYSSVSSGFICNTFSPTLSSMTALVDLKLLGEMNWAWNDADRVMPIPTVSWWSCTRYSISTSNDWELHGLGSRWEGQGVF